MPTPAPLVVLLGLLLCAGRAFAASPPPAAPTPSPAAPAGASAAVAEPDEDAGPAPAKADPAAEKFWQALKSFRDPTPAGLAAGRALLQASSDLEYTHAQVLLANCHLSGSYGFRRDARRAAALFRLAAERGNGFARVSLGQCYYSGTGGPKDAGKAFQWLSAAVADDADFSRPVRPAAFDAEAPASAAADDQGVAGELASDPAADARATAHYLLGLLCNEKKDPVAAQKHWVAAATAGPAGRSGIYLAAVQAALNYAFGKGVPRDMAQANAMLDQSKKLVRRLGVSQIHNYAQIKLVDEFAVADLEEAVAKAGDEAQADVQFSIAELFANRKSKEYNPKEAVKWYALAAESGRAWAILSLAFVYSQGDLGQPDPVEAFKWFERAGGGDKPKHYLGAANLGICYANGLGTAKDPAKAADLFKKHRDHDFVCYLGSIGHCPNHVLTYEQAVALNQLWAEKKNDAQAQYFLGNRYWRGEGVMEDNTSALRWWKRAAKAGHPLALYELGEVCRRHPGIAEFSSWDSAYKQALIYFRRGLEAGNASCAAVLGYMTDEGQGVPANQQEAAKLYAEALRLDPQSGMAHNNLAWILEQQLVVALKTADGPAESAARAQILHHLEEAEKSGDEKAAYNLGRLHRDGKVFEKDLRLAYGHFETAAERGDVLSRFIVGQMNEQGEGVPVNYTEAAYHYRLAALEGHAEALSRLADLYLTGKGVSQDFDRAAFWLNLMARSGKVAALVSLGDIALKKGDYADAAKLFKTLQESNNDLIAGYANERLSRCYQNGWGVKASSERAGTCFEKAVQLGNGDALYRKAMQTMAAGKNAESLTLFEKAAPKSPAASLALGRMCFFGTNLAPDRPRAWKLLRAAAEGGNTEAMYFLAAATYNKVPDAPTLDEAVRLAEQADSAGHPKAAALRDKLEKRRQAGAAAPAEDSAPRSM